MNTGAISSRYAKALLKLVNETGRGEVVFDQARALLADPDLAKHEIEPEIGKLVELLVRNNRTQYLKFVLRSFVSMYEEQEGISEVRLVTAVPSPDLEQSLKDLLSKSTGHRLLFQTSTDPGLIGGFVLEMDNNMLDASISRQIEAVRRQFIEKNKRIV